MSQLEYPKTVSVKKNLVFVAALMGALLIGYIFYNVYHTFEAIKHPDTKMKTAPPVTATDADMQWYRAARIPVKSPLPVMVVTSPGRAQQKTMPAGTPSVSAQTFPAVVQTAPSVTAEDLKAMAAPISSNQLTFENPTTPMGTAQSTALPRAATLTKGQSNDPNQQEEKQAFVSQAGQSDIYLSSRVQTPVSPLELQAGTIIPGILITGINSDLPGQLTGRVTETVYDSIAGAHILIPQGSTLKGVYDSQIAYGQERILVVWQRVIFPNGKSIDLQGMPGVDMSGNAGLHDQVNNHYWKIAKSVVLVSVLSAGAQLSQPQYDEDDNNDDLTVNQQLAQSLGTNIASAGTQLFQKDINIQPTLNIRPGEPFNIMVAKDIVFDDVYDDL